MEMKSKISVLFIFQTIILSVNIVIAREEVRHVCRGEDFKSDTIQKNRDAALDKIMTTVKNSSYHGFYHSQAGDKPEEQVSASLFCPPNIPGEICKCCFRNLVPYLLKKCPKQNEAVAWDSYFFLDCMVRYSTGRTILSVLDDWAWYRRPDINNVKSVELVKTMDDLVSKLKEEAAGGDEVQKYASGTVKYEGDEHVLYAIVQCTPDLSKEDCIKCLSKASTEIHNCCTRKPLFSGRVMSTNCYIRYSHLDILNVPELSPEACSF